MRKASKMKQKPDTIQVVMNINGNVYYECSLDQSMKSVMEHFLELRLKHKPTKDEMTSLCIVDFSKPNVPLPLHKTVRQCGIKDDTRLESRNLRKELLWVRPLSNLKKPKKKSKAHESSQDQEEEDDDPFQIYSAPTAVNPSTYITDMLNNLYDQFMDKYQY